MTAATVTTRYRGIPFEIEHVTLTATDGETYVTDMSSPQVVQITSSEDMGSETNSWSYSKSGRTITLYADGVTDKLVDLTIYGYK